MRHVAVLNERLVGGIVQDDGVVLLGVRHPTGELLARGGGTGRVIGVTQVNDVCLLCGESGHKIIFRGARQVNDAFVLTGVIRVAGVAGHHVGIQIHRIHRVGDGNAVLMAEDIQDVGGIALGAVGYENLIGTDIHASSGKIILSNGFAQELIAQFRAVAAEGVAISHFIHGGVKCLHAGGGQGFGHIANAAADQARGGVRIGLGKLVHAAANLGEEITGLQLQVMLVDVCHGGRDGSETAVFCQAVRRYFPIK